VELYRLAGYGINNADAYYKLGMMYESGRGVSQNDVTAKRLYEYAANKNHPGAKIRLLILKNNPLIYTKPNKLAMRTNEDFSVAAAVV